MHHLLLWLEAPLQSWGHDSLFRKRDSLDFPTKSGILGMVACALGAISLDDDFLSCWRETDLSINGYALDPCGHTSTSFSMLNDFQSVGHGYEVSSPDEWGRLMRPARADGARGNGLVLNRTYIQDAAFAAVLTHPNRQWLDSIYAALHAPRWDFYLGRKNCIPTEVVGQGIFETPFSLMHRIHDLATSKGRVCVLASRSNDIVAQSNEPWLTQMQWISDEVITFDRVKTYAQRCVWVTRGCINLPDNEFIL